MLKRKQSHKMIQMFKGLIPYNIILYHSLSFLLASALGITPKPWCDHGFWSTNDLSGHRSTTIPQDPWTNPGPWRWQRPRNSRRRTPNSSICSPNSWGFHQEWTMDGPWTNCHLSKPPKINKPDFWQPPKKDRNGAILHHLNGILQKLRSFRGVREWLTWKGVMNKTGRCPDDFRGK